MAPWLIPALKAVLPHVATIITATAPAFTRRRVEAPNEQMNLLQQQIAELQSAASQNDAHVRDLAEQLQRTVAALEDAASAAGRRLVLVTLLSGLALVISSAALAVAIAT